MKPKPTKIAFVLDASLKKYSHPVIFILFLTIIKYLSTVVSASLLCVYCKNTMDIDSHYIIQPKKNNHALYRTARLTGNQRKKNIFWCARENRYCAPDKSCQMHRKVS